MKNEIVQARAEAVALAAAHRAAEAGWKVQAREAERTAAAAQAELHAALGVELAERDRAHARASEATRVEAAEATRSLAAQHAQVSPGYRMSCTPSLLPPCNGPLCRGCL